MYCMGYSSEWCRAVFYIYFVCRGFLEVGLDRIVDQVVNPKIVPCFMPKVEDVVYETLNIEKPKLPLSATIGKFSYNGLVSHFRILYQISDAVIFVCLF